MPPKPKKGDLDPEQSIIWEKIMVLAQRIDKLEYTTHDLRDDFKSFVEKDFNELKTSVTNAIRDDSYRRHDWLKAGLTIGAAVLLTGFLIWFSIVSKVNTLDVLVHQDVQWTPHFVTKDQLQNSMNEFLEKLKKELQNQGKVQPSATSPLGIPDDKKAAEVTK